VEIDAIETNIGIGRSLFVTAMETAGMLGKPGNPGWAEQELREDVVWFGSPWIRLLAVRLYAERNGIRLSPARASRWFDAAR